MSIVLKNVWKSYDSQTVLERVNFILNVGDKIAVIGENGMGKSTLLKLLSGEEDLTLGERYVDDRAMVAVVSQDFPTHYLERGITVREFINEQGGQSLFRRVDKILREFCFPERLMDTSLSMLSGGQQKIVDLSVAFGLQTGVLLLDEPENHIDIFARQVLISLIRNHRGAIAFVSHDQDLINSTTNKIVEVENHSLWSYTGGYEFYLAEKKRQEEGRERAWKTHERKVEQLDRLIKRMHQWVKLNPDLGAQLSSRKTQLERIKANAPSRPRSKKLITLSIKNSDRVTGKRMFLVDGLRLERGGTYLLWDVSLSLFYGQKVALVGRNGSGKTSFIKALMGDVPFQGTIRVGDSVSLGYFSQDTADILDLKETPLEALEKITSGEQHVLRALLAKYLIGAEHCNRPIGKLSGGQKTRLRFCLLFAHKYELLILDEPTNHLDPVTWDIVAGAITEYQGAVLLVSHDRVFVDSTVKQLWVIDNRQIALYHGTLGEYLLEES